MSQTDIIRKVDRFSRIAQAERLFSPQIIQKTKAVRHPGGRRIIFEVQDKATGDGIYKCYEQKLVGDNWDNITGADKFANKNTVFIEVLNLQENNPVSDYTPALFKYDKIEAWQIKDDKGEFRWIGNPITPPLRFVIAKEDGPNLSIYDNSITCNAWLNTEAEAVEGELGFGIEVWGRDSPPGTFWSNAVPRIINGNAYFVFCKQGTWYFAEMMMKSCVGDLVVCA